MTLGRKFAARRSPSLIPARLRQMETEKKAIPKDMMKRGWRRIPTMGENTASESCSHQESREGTIARETIDPEPTGSNQDIVHQRSWRLDLLQRLEPASPSFGVFQQRAARFTASSVLLEILQLGARQSLIEGIAE